MRNVSRQAASAVMLAMATMPLRADEHGAAADVSRLLRAYQELLASIDSNTLVWRDGTRMSIDDGKGKKSFVALLEDPDIEDIFAIPYTKGDSVAPPAKDADPGRARPSAFFDKMYGNCRKNEVAANLVEVVWLPKKSGEKLKITRVNGVADKLKAISDEFDALPSSFDAFLTPSGGTYNCRTIAGTNRISAHGQGIAIDIAVGRSNYWRWAKPSADGSYAYKNQVPMEIVRIFEKHGFIWGGKWHHYDTMHFEYRPELLVE